jgi:hypothetical protein
MRMDGKLYQDEINFEPLVWATAGEVVGNYVQLCVRHIGTFYHWFGNIETTLGEQIAHGGVRDDLDDAMQAACDFASSVLEYGAVPPAPEDE